MNVDEIVERWHSGEWPYRRLEDVIREHTQWSAKEYDEWVLTGAVSAHPQERVR
jgi:hypothetical protein